MYFDFDELDSLEAASAKHAETVRIQPVKAADLETNIKIQQAASAKHDETARSEPVKAADPETTMKIQQALEEAVRRRRKAAGLAEENVPDSDLTTKIQKAVEDARLRSENSKPQELSKFDEAVQKALVGARKRQNVPASSTNLYQSSAEGQWNSGSSYGSWWPWPITSTPIANHVPVDGDGWDQPIQAGASYMTKQARIQLGRACVDAKVLDNEVKKVLDEAKARQAQTYFASAEPSMPHNAVEQIQKAQMVAESRSYLSNKFLQARRMAPYKPKLKDEPAQEVAAQEVAAQAKNIRWADQSDDSDGEAEGASPRQRGGG